MATADGLKQISPGQALYVGPYFKGLQGQQTITYHYRKGGEGFEYYCTLFEKLWNDPEFCRPFGSFKAKPLAVPAEPQQQ